MTQKLKKLIFYNSLHYFITKKWLSFSSFNKIRNISIITILSIFLSIFLTFILIISLNYFHYLIRYSLLSNNLDLSFSAATISEKKLFQIQKSLKDNFNIQNIFKYSNVKGFLYTAYNKQPIVLKAINNSQFNKLFIDIQQGSFDVSLPSILINKNLLKKMHLKIGSIISFVSFSQSDHSLPIILKFKITGSFTTKYSLSHLDAITPLKYMPLDFSPSIQAGLLLKKETSTQSVTDFLLKQYQITVHSFEKSYFNILYALKWENILLTIVLVFIIMINFLIIYKSFQLVLKMLVPRISIIRFMGISYSSIVKSFFYYTLINIIFSIGIALIGILFIFYILIPLLLNYFYPSIYSTYSYFISCYNLISLEDFIGFTILESLCIIFSFLQPILKLKKHSVLEGLYQ